MPQLPLPEGQACYGAVTLAGGTVLAPEAEFQWQQGCVVQAEQRQGGNPAWGPCSIGLLPGPSLEPKPCCLPKVLLETPVCRLWFGVFFRLLV